MRFLSLRVSHFSGLLIYCVRAVYAHHCSLPRTLETQSQVLHRPGLILMHFRPSCKPVWPFYGRCRSQFLDRRATVGSEGPTGCMELITGGLHILRSVGDEQRDRALATPVAQAADVRHTLGCIMPSMRGILGSEDPAIRLISQKPKLMASIPLYINTLQTEQQIPPPDIPDLMYLSQLVFRSYKDRKHLLNLVNEIHNEWTLVVERAAVIYRSMSRLGSRPSWS